MHASSSQGAVKFLGHFLHLRLRHAALDLLSRRLFPLQRRSVVVVDVLPDAQLRIRQELVLGVVALVDAADLGHAVQVAHEGPRVHLLLARPDLIVVDEIPLLQHLHHVRLAQDARRLDVGLGDVHVEGVEGDEDALIEGHGRRPVLRAEGGVGGVLVDGVAAGEVLGGRVDLRFYGDSGADPEDENSREEGLGHRVREAESRAEAEGGGDLHPRPPVGRSQVVRRPAPATALRTVVVVSAAVVVVIVIVVVVVVVPIVVVLVSPPGIRSDPSRSCRNARFRPHQRRGRERKSFRRRSGRGRHDKGRRNIPPAYHGCCTGELSRCCVDGAARSEGGAAAVMIPVALQNLTI
mmetsp:Transcript_20922/g.60923  ORF Transcript_20922/g.60923 Transcript_20922/m.60923 type:complete len:351 (-) Transcript_20922:2-1054(-)